MIRSLRCFLVAILVPAALLAASDRPIKSVNAPLTASEPESDLLWVVGGDNRPTGHGAPLARVMRTIFGEVRMIRPEFVIWSGDIFYGYNDTKDELTAEYDAFLKEAKVTAVPFFNAPGNHEIHPPKGCADAEAVTQFVSHFGNLYGSFDYKGVHFIALDTAECEHNDRIEGAQLTWLRADLETNKSARAIFVFCHTEFFQAPGIDKDQKDTHPVLGNADEIHQLLRNYPVRAVFTGHEHLYDHQTHDGIEYFIAGGGGAPMYATPDHGGFSSYVVVQLRGDTLRYDVVEPGRLYNEQGKSAKANEVLQWIVNSSDVDIPLRGVEVSVPASLGQCKDLVAESRLTKYDGTLIPLPVTVSSCTTKNSKRTLTLQLIAPKRQSVPVAIHRK